jgi:hypothetical protein
MDHFPFFHCFFFIISVYLLLSDILSEENFKKIISGMHFNFYSYVMQCSFKCKCVII